MDVSPLTVTGAPVLDADSPRLKSAAHEFEASLMQELLKPLQHDALFDDSDGSSSFVSGGGVGGDSGDGGSDAALLSFGSMAMAKAISERGGFGIATRILDHFRTSPASQIRGSATKL